MQNLFIFEHAIVKFSQRIRTISFNLILYPHPIKLPPEDQRPSAVHRQNKETADDKTWPRSATKAKTNSVASPLCSPSPLSFLDLARPLARAAFSRLRLHSTVCYTAPPPLGPARLVLTTSILASSFLRNNSVYCETATYCERVDIAKVTPFLHTQVRLSCHVITKPALTWL